MKKNTKRVLSILTALGMCQTFAFNVMADEEYQSLSMGSMQSVFEKGAQPVYIEPVAYDAQGVEMQIDDPTALSYASSNENVVKVNADGQMSFVDYGVAVVTAVSGEISTSMLVTVTPNEYSKADFETDSGSTDNPRNGAKSLKIAGEITTFRDWNQSGGPEVQAAKQESLIWGANDKKSNNVLQAWFYDNGQTENSEAGISFKRHENYCNTGAIGIINAADTTYKISRVNGRWDQIEYPDHMTNAADTGILRTPGWHQVAIVQKNLSGDVLSDDGGDSKSTGYTVYLDGKEVTSNTSTENTKYIILGYAGATEGSCAYFDDASRAEYMALENVNIAADENDGELLTANLTYYGTTASASVTASYQWYASETKDGEYSAIDGANEKTYRPDAAALGNRKFIKVGATVTDVGNATEEYMSDASFIFTGVYESISINKSELSLNKNEEKQLKLVGYDSVGVERAISDLSGVTFTSSKPEIAEIGADGILKAKDYGTTTVTAEREGLKSSALVTVVAGNYVHSGWQGALHKDYNESATPVARTGQGAAAKTGKINGTTNQPEAQSAIWMNNEITIENVVSTAYFYDNGQNTDAEAAIDFGRYQSWAYGGAYGVINSADTTYKMVTHLPNNMYNGSVYVDKATDLGIARTKGWHQVTMIQKRLSGNTNAPGGRPDSYAVYFDGIKVRDKICGSAEPTMDMIRFYAGGDSNHVAYFDDVDTFYYTELADVTISADETDGETLVANAQYYGANSTDDASAYYQWYMSDEENGEYTKIANATSKTYKPSGNAAGKFIKAGVRVSDQIENKNETLETETAERFSEPIYAFDGIYQSISLGKSDSYFVKGETSEAQLKITGFGKDGLERGISDISGFSFTSSNKDVADVDASGKLTIKDYGRTTITATLAELSASLMVTVTPKTIRTADNDSALTAIARRGQGALSVAGGIDEYTDHNDGSKQTAGKSAISIWNWTMGASNSVSEMWFYDNGAKENATAAVNFTSYENYSMTKALGVIDSASDYYQLANTDGRWDKVKVSHLETAENTKILRTPGWHQVTIVQTNPSGDEFYTNARSEFGGKAAKTTHYTLYLDGRQVMDSDSATIARFIITAQAGQFETNTAWFDDAVQNRYISVENLKITETENGAYSADFDYYGISKDAVAEYKWYVSDTVDGEYGIIANETSKTFTPDAETAGKFIKASVKITDTLDGSTFATNERFTESVLAGGTFMEYLANGKLLITADKNIENAAAVIAVYEQSGDFQKLVSAKVVDSISVSKGNSKIVTIGTVSKTDTQTAKIMLWDGIKTQKAICNAITVE